MIKKWYEKSKDVNKKIFMNQLKIIYGLFEEYHVLLAKFGNNHKKPKKKLKGGGVCKNV